MSAAPGKATIAERRQLNLSIDDEHAKQLIAVADAVTDGNKSKALVYLLDTYAGVIVERAAQKKELEERPAPIVQWKQPRLTSELAAFVAGMVRAGNVLEVACEMAGIGPRQRANWLKQGRSDRVHGRESLHADFVANVERAEAECEAEDIARLRKHGNVSWQALAWRLERQHPDRYAQRKRIDGKVQHSVFPVVDWDRLTPAETRTFVELLRKASPEMDDPGVSRAARPALELVPGEVLDVIDGEAVDVTGETE